MSDCVLVCCFIYFFTLLSGTNEFIDLLLIAPTEQNNPF